MSYRKLQPAEVLKPYVESIWIQEDLTYDPNWQPTRIIPTTRSDMLFYFREPFVTHSNGGSEKIPMCVLHGQMTKPLHVSATGKTGLIIFSFYPWGIAPFINIPFYEFTDKSIDLGLVFGHKVIRELHEKIVDSNTNEDRIKLIEDFLINNLPENPVDHFGCKFAKLINQRLGNVQLTGIAKELNISRRHLQRRFSLATGLSPKQFAEIIRFQKALYLKRKGYHWADIAETCGYYDQSHFIKKVKTFTGTSPEKIYADVKPTKLMRYFNAVEQMSHFYNTIYL